MICFVPPARRARYHRALYEYYRHRKHEYCDRLGWTQPNAQGLEVDKFDELKNLYIFKLDGAQRRFAAGVRLMPTTGPTLTHRQWRHLLPNPSAFVSPSIWEASRFVLTNRGYPHPSRASLSLLLAIMKFCGANDISHVIGVFEWRCFVFSGAFGAEVEIVSRTRDRNGNYFGCGIWKVDAELTQSSGARKLLAGADDLAINRNLGVTTISTRSN